MVDATLFAVLCTRYLATAATLAEMIRRMIVRVVEKPANCREMSVPVVATQSGMAGAVPNGFVP